MNFKNNETIENERLKNATQLNSQWKIF